MEAVILIGIQGAGKSTFYERRLASTHPRVSLDLAGTKAREERLMRSCIDEGLDFAVDNTNATPEGRKRYIESAKAAGYQVIGYYFPPDLKESLRRNAARSGKAKVPVPGIYGTLKRLRPPALAEGFDRLYTVEILGDEFRVTEQKG